MKGLLGKKRQKEFFKKKNENKAIFKSLNFFGQRLDVKLSVIALTLYGLLNSCTKAVELLQCLSNGYLMSLNSEKGKTPLNSKGILKKCIFLTMLSDYPRYATTLKTAEHTLPCTPS